MIRRDDLSLDVVSSSGSHPVETGHEAHLEHRDSDGPSDLFHHRLHELVLPLLHDVGCLQEYLSPLARW